MDITDSETYRQLVNSALRFVSIRLRSRKEILLYLETKLNRSHTSAPGVVDAVLRRLEELSYINDEAFAEWLAQGRTGRKPKGRRSIEQELAQKGVARDIIERVLAHTMTGARSEKELARTLARKKLPLWKTEPILIQKRKLADLLSRRGFSSETVWGVVDELAPTE